MGRVFYTDLPSHLRFTLVALADHANDDGSGVWVGKERLARKVGLSVRAVYDNLRALRDAGYIAHEGRTGPNGTARYRLLLERLPEVDRQPTADRQILPTGSPPHELASRPAVDRTVDRQPTASKPSLTITQKQPSLSRAKAGEAEAFVAAYHRYCPMLPKCSGLTDKRRRQIATRLRERPLEQWALIFGATAASSFHTGGGPSGWRASLDWLIKNAENGLKLLEQSSAPAQPTKPREFAAGGVPMRTVEETRARLATVRR
jgi:hypothetical protein